MAVAQFYPCSDTAIRFLLGGIRRENLSSVALLSFSHIAQYKSIKNRQNDGQDGTKNHKFKKTNTNIQWTVWHSQDKVHDSCVAEFWAFVRGIQPCAQNPSWTGGDEAHGNTCGAPVVRFRVVRHPRGDDRCTGVHTRDHEVESAVSDMLVLSSYAKITINFRKRNSESEMNIPKNVANPATPMVHTITKGITLFLYLSDEYASIRVTGKTLVKQSGVDLISNRR